MRLRNFVAVRPVSVAGLLAAFALAGCGSEAARPALTFDELSACARDSLAIETERSRIITEVRALKARERVLSEAAGLPEGDRRRAAYDSGAAAMNRDMLALLSANQEVLQRADDRNGRCGDRQIAKADRARLSPELQGVIPREGEDTAGVAMSYAQSVACARRAVTEEAETARVAAAQASAKAGRPAAAALEAQVRARSAQATAFAFDCLLQPHAPEHLGELPPELQPALAHALGFRTKEEAAAAREKAAASG